MGIFAWKKLPKAVALGAGAALVAAVYAAGRPAPPRDLRIVIEQLEAGRLWITYYLPEAQNALRFEALSGDYRARRWRFETDEFVLREDGDGAFVERRDGGEFNRVILVAEPDDAFLEKDYQPIAPFGDDGALVYLGHFWPRDGAGRRIGARFSFNARPDDFVVAFAERSGRIGGWRSPTGQPAFIYMGPVAPVETDEIIAIIDPETPQWIVDEIFALTPRVSARLGAAFGASLAAKSMLFLSASPGGGEGQLAFAGDATPGQLQITLRGAAWARRSEKALAILRRSGVHEAVHLFQAAARPGADAVPDWIHEGGADAIAAETLVGLGIWDEAEYAADFEAARAECAARLGEGPLSAAEAQGRYRALYACGRIIAEAVARADGAPVADFWRAFIARSADDGGYSEATFNALVAERTGDAEFARDLRYFITTPAADPALEIDRLFAAAGAPLAPSAPR